MGRAAQRAQKGEAAEAGRGRAESESSSGQLFVDGAIFSGVRKEGGVKVQYTDGRPDFWRGVHNLSHPDDKYYADTSKAIPRSLPCLAPPTPSGHACVPAPVGVNYPRGM